MLGMLGLEGDAGEMQEVIARQAAHMSQIVDDLLDVSRIARGKLSLRRRHVDVDALLADAVRDYCRGHVLAPAQIAYRGAGRPVWVWADPTRLTQALANVLHNSVKFGDDENQIAVSLEVAGEPSQQQAVVSVVDRGIGMTAETLSRIFEPFNQADTSLERSRGGLGLGLALTRGLVELHGGTIAAESPGLGGGATVSFSLPVSAPPEQSPDHAAPPAAQPQRVLVIDDRRDAVAPLRRMLQRQGHAVSVASSGVDGLAQAAEFRPDVILCDIGLESAMNGYDVCRALRATPEGAAAYLVAVTGYGQEEDRRLAREAGFDYHLTKPVAHDQLVDLLAHMPRF